MFPDGPYGRALPGVLCEKTRDEADAPAGCPRRPGPPKRRTSEPPDGSRASEPPRRQPRRTLGRGWTQQVRCGLEARSPGSEGYGPARKLPSSRSPGRAPKKYRVSPCSLVVAVGTPALRSRSPEPGARRARARPARPGRAAGFTRPGHSALATGAPEVDAAKVVSVCIFLITSVIEHLFRRLAGLPRLWSPHLQLRKAARLCLAPHLCLAPRPLPALTSLFPAQSPDVRFLSVTHHSAVVRFPKTVISFVLSSFQGSFGSIRCSLVWWAWVRGR